MIEGSGSNLTLSPGGYNVSHVSGLGTLEIVLMILHAAFQEHCGCNINTDKNDICIIHQFVSYKTT